MKEYIELFRSKLNNYLVLNEKYKKNSLAILDFVLFSDFKPHEDNFLIHPVNCYNVSFIYHDFKNKMLYIGRSDWELYDDIKSPSNEEFPQYVNETNSCKMSVDNFMEFRERWIEIKKTLSAFVLLYRDELDWVHCRGFASQADMEFFVKNYTVQVAH